MKDMEYDAVIVGAGLLGLALAYHIKGLRRVEPEKLIM